MGQVVCVPGRFCIAHIIKPYKLVMVLHMWVTKFITPLAPGIAFTSLLKLTPSMLFTYGTTFVVDTRFKLINVKHYLTYPRYNPLDNQAHCNLLLAYGMEFFTHQAAFGLIPDMKRMQRFLLPPSIVLNQDWIHKVFWYPQLSYLILSYHIISSQSFYLDVVSL